MLTKNPQTCCILKNGSLLQSYSSETQMGSSRDMRVVTYQRGVWVCVCLDEAYLNIFSLHYVTINSINYQRIVSHRVISFLSNEKSFNCVAAMPYVMY